MSSGFATGMAGALSRQCRLKWEGFPGGETHPHSMNQGKEAADMRSTLGRAIGVSLRNVFPEARIFGADEIRVTSCCSDPLACRPGDLYIAVPDGDKDGLESVQQAMQRGAAAVLAEAYQPIGIPQCIASDAREAYGIVCQALAGNPTRSMHVVGVTGTSGKTSTSLLTASVLRAAGLTTGFTTTLVHSDSHESAAASRTMPIPTEMADWLLRMKTNGCSHAVTEISSRALAQRRAAGMSFDAAVVTNLRRDHIDFHGDLANYRRAKERLFEQLSPEGFVVLNADDAGSQLVMSRLQSPVITFGMRERAEVSATVIERHPSEQTFLLSAGNESVPVRTRMIGDQHVENCLAAAAVGLVFGADLTTIARGLEAIERIPNRLDRVECGQPFNVFVDCADTPERLATSLKTVRQVTRGRVIAIFGSEERGDPADRPLLGRAVDRGADVGVLTSGPYGHERPLTRIHELLDGYDRPAKAQVMPSRSRAIVWALGQARPGDSIVIAGSHRRTLTDDAQAEQDGDVAIARDWLYKSAANDDAAVFGIA
jgi:UDP-N-acetylmuramoyl-L-alanyl-D-glutamate--2,6-diaminopimelate ligase